MTLYIFEVTYEDRRGAVNRTTLERYSQRAAEECVAALGGCAKVLSSREVGR